MGINFNPNISLNSINFRATENIKRPVAQQTQPDTFVRQDPKIMYRQRLEYLFPNGELEQIFLEMCKEIGLDYPPRLVIADENNPDAGGGYYFTKNTIYLDITDSLGATSKIYGIKDGKKEVIISDNTGLPLIIDPRVAFILNLKQPKIKDYDKISAEPATREDCRKLFLQKLCHEIIHAKQHAIMQQTEGIGDKAIIKAWFHAPKNLDPKQEQALNKAIKEQYNKSFWKTHSTKVIYSKDSAEGIKANEYLNAIQNYPAEIDSPEYLENTIEKEAYWQSAEYIIEKYGEWT